MPGGFLLNSIYVALYMVGYSIRELLSPVGDRFLGLYYPCLPFRSFSISSELQSGQFIDNVSTPEQGLLFVSRHPHFLMRRMDSGYPDEESLLMECTTLS